MFKTILWWPKIDKGRYCQEQPGTAKYSQEGVKYSQLQSGTVRHIHVHPGTPMYIHVQPCIARLSRIQPGAVLVKSHRPWNGQSFRSVGVRQKYKMIPSQMVVATHHWTVDATQKRRLPGGRCSSWSCVYFSRSGRRLSKSLTQLCKRPICVRRGGRAESSNARRKITSQAAAVPRVTAVFGNNRQNPTEWFGCL